MVDLLDLPEEVLNHIISRINVAVFYNNDVFTIKHWPTMCNLLLTCQRLHGIAKAHMFDELTFIASAHVDQSRSRLDKFVSAYEAGAVQEAKIKSVRLFDTNWQDDPPSEIIVMLKILIRSSSLTKLQLSLHSYRILHNLVVSREWSLYWTRLATQSFEYSSSRGLTDAILDDYSGPFASLRDLRLGETIDSGSPYIDPRLLLRLVSLPSLERLETTKPIVYEGFPHKPQLLLRRRVLRLRELLCWDPYLSKDVLTTIVSHAPYLQLLNIPSVTPFDLDGLPHNQYGRLERPRRLTNIEIIEILNPIRETLLYLCLRETSWVLALDKVDSLDFSTFKNLRTLEIPGYLMIGQRDTILEIDAHSFSRFLPPALEEIHIKIAANQGILYLPTELSNACHTSEISWTDLWQRRETLFRQWLDDMIRALPQSTALRSMGLYDFAGYHHPVCCNSCYRVCEIQAKAVEWTLQQPLDTISRLTARMILRFPEQASTTLPVRSASYLEHLSGISRAPGGSEGGRHQVIPEGVVRYEDAMLTGDNPAAESPPESP